MSDNRVTVNTGCGCFVLFIVIICFAIYGVIAAIGGWHG